MACVLPPDVEPLVHEVYAPSSETWQYVVADPRSRRCALIDPVMDPNDSRLSTRPADDLLAVVCQNKYKVDIIVETHASSRDNRSGAWYLRMQLRDIQGFAPRVASGQAVSGVEKLFARKYGTTLQTHLDGEFRDGEELEIGQLSMKVWYLPGVCTPDARGYQIGMNLFGAHSIADLKNRMQQENFAQQLQQMDEDDCHSLWESFQRVLGLPPDYRLYFDRGKPDFSIPPRVRFDGDEAAGEMFVKRKGVVLQPAFTTVGHCRAMNTQIEVTAAEFMKLWEEGKTRRPMTAAGRPMTATARPRTAAPEQTEQITPRGGSKPIKHQEPALKKKPSWVGNLFRSKK